MKNLINILSITMFLTSCGGQLQKLETVASGVIIGEDSRLQMQPNHRDGRKVGKLIFQKDDGKVYECSATLIGHDYIISAAHCFVGPGNSVFDDGHFLPDINGADNLKHIYGIEKVFLNTNYVKLVGNKKENTRDISLEAVANDFAIAKLSVGKGQTSAGKLYGITSYWGKVEHEGYVDDGLMIGYPGDKPSGHKFHETCSFYDLKYNGLKNLYGTDCDVIQGQSGSPVYFRHPETKNYHLRGIVSAEGTEENYVALLAAEDHIEISKIIKGEHDNLDRFTTFLMNDRPFGSLKITNNCKEDLYIATYAKRVKEDNGHSTKAYYVVKAGESTVIHSLVDDRFGFYAQNQRGSTIFAGNEYKHAADSAMRGGFRSAVMKEFPGVHNISFGCK